MALQGAANSWTSAPNQPIRFAIDATLTNRPGSESTAKPPSVKSDCETVFCAPSSECILPPSPSKHLMGLPVDLDKQHPVIVLAADARGADGEGLSRASSPRQPSHHPEPLTKEWILKRHARSISVLKKASFCCICRLGLLRLTMPTCSITGCILRHMRTPPMARLLPLGVWGEGGIRGARTTNTPPPMACTQQPAPHQPRRPAPALEAAA